MEERDAGSFSQKRNPSIPMKINEILQHLLDLQSLDFNEVENKDAEKQAAELRAQIPPPVLQHYDRLRAGGKKGVAAVRHQVCTGCHMQVPRATVLTLMHGDDIQVCGNCGRYLHLQESEETAAPAVAPAAKPAKLASKSRKHGELTHAA